MYPSILLPLFLNSTIIVVIHNPLTTLYFIDQMEKVDYHLLFDLSLEDKKLRIKVRITRIWDSVNPMLNNELMSVDCVMVDKKVF